MARATNKHSSRRRTAALKFLSSISFETSSSTKEDANSEQVLHVEEEKQQKIDKRITTEIGIGTVNEFIPAKFVEMESCKPSSYIPFRERSNTGSREFKLQREKQKKMADDFPAPLSYSSTESITSGRSIRSLRQKTDFHKLKEVKVGRASNLRYYKNERVMLVSPASKTPFYVFSFLPYRKTKSKGELKKESSSRRRNLSGSRPLSSFIDTLDPFLLLGLEKYHDEQMISYQQLLFSAIYLSSDARDSSQDYDESFSENSTIKNVHMSRCMSVDLGGPGKPQAIPSSSPPFSEFRANDWEEFGQSAQDPYSPYILDDPELMSGKHRTVLTFPSYRTSIIDYVRPSDLKKELNEKFREKFPHIQLTLSKLRSLKRDMKKLSKSEKCVDLLTVAQAYVYFEKLILRNVINKTNRKLCAAVCLLLSAKMNDTKGSALKQLLEKLESVFRLSRKDVLSLEFAVVVALEFGLHVPTWEILPHYQRLMYES